MLVLSEEYKKILSSAAMADGQMLLYTTERGEWYLNIVDLRLPQKQSRYASAKIRETVADLLKHGLVRFEGPPGKEDGLYTVTVKGFEECGLKE